MEFVKRENKTKNEEYRKKGELAVGKLAEQAVRVFPQTFPG